MAKRGPEAEQLTKLSACAAQRDTELLILETSRRPTGAGKWYQGICNPFSGPSVLLIKDFKNIKSEESPRTALLA